MADNSTPSAGGFLITLKSISAFLAVITLTVTLYTGVSNVNRYIYKIEKLEGDQVQLLSLIDRLDKKLDQYNAKFDISNDKIIDLTITLNRLEERLKSMERTK